MRVLKFQSVRSFLSLLLVCTVAGADDAAAPSQPVTIAQSYAVPSKILGQVRHINVYLPKGYEKGGQRYPVLYLLDGGIQEDFLHIAGIASLAADFRRLREFIVIGIEGIDRYHDLVHPTTIESEKKKLPTSGSSAAFRDFLTRELKPFVKSHFRLTAETVLIGESAGGLFVVETFLRQPDLFQGYIAVSPSVWWNGQSLSKEAAALLQKRPFPANRRVFLTLGDEGSEMREGIDRVVAALKAEAPADLALTFAPMESETHGTIFHPAALFAIRKFFATVEAAK